MAILLNAVKYNGHITEARIHKLACTLTHSFVISSPCLILSPYLLVNPRGDHWAEFGPRDQCRLCARPKFGPIWYDVVVQFSFPSLVTDTGKQGVIGKLIHSSFCANFIQVQNA